LQEPAKKHRFDLKSRCRRRKFSQIFAGDTDEEKKKKEERIEVFEEEGSEWCFPLSPFRAMEVFCFIPGLDLVELLFS
jgi:hypothetical protein